MPRRARTPPPAVDRVRELLARTPTTGWLPPPEDGDVRSWADDAAGRTAGALTQRPPEVDPAHGWHGASSGWTEQDDPAADDDPEPDPGAVPRAGGISVGERVASMLPVGLRTGRLDPGRRGALALVLVALLAALVAGAVVMRGRPQEVLVPQVLVSGSPLPGVSAEPDPAAQVVVSVAGKVRRPGIVRLPAGSRVDDAVKAAGGPVDDVDTGLLNLARRLVDGEQVLVGVEPPPGVPAAAGGTVTGGLLDLNTATVGDLDALPGIGPVLAQRIVDWRTEHDRFGSVDQLREVTGIGEAKFEDLREKVTV